MPEYCKVGATGLWRGLDLPCSDSRRTHPVKVARPFSQSAASSALSSSSVGVSPLRCIARTFSSYRWNYLIGFNWEMYRQWSVMVEAGFGGSRDNFIAGATYRF